MKKPFDFVKEYIYHREIKQFESSSLPAILNATKNWIENVEPDIVFVSWLLAREKDQIIMQDNLFDKAKQFAIDNGGVSVVKLQRHLICGYAKAARILDELVSTNIVEPVEKSTFYQIVPANKANRRD